MSEFGPLHEFRVRNTQRMGVGALFASIPIALTRLVQYLSAPTTAHLAAAIVWFVFLTVSLWNYREIKRERLGLNIRLLLVSMSAVAVVNTLTEDSGGMALFTLGLAFPFVCLTAIATEEESNQGGWIIALTLMFAGTAFGRQLLAPIEAFALTQNLLSVAIGGSVALAAFGLVIRSLVSSLKRLLLESERTGALLSDRNTQLEEARDAALAATQVKSEFLATMSHELRTPLNAIIGYSELILEDMPERASTDLPDDDNATLGADVRRIHAAAQHLLALINDILDLSKIEAGRMELHVTPVELDAAMESVVALVRNMVKKSGNRFELSLPPTLGLIHTDRTKLRQILLNLLSNASKFTTRGVITLTARRADVVGAGRSLVLTVRDTGVGIAPDRVETLFEPFVQADGSRSREQDGTGLGLTITRHFCEMMGGAITLESELGIGSEFTVTLPDLEGGDAYADLAARSRTSRARAGETLVLVVDDDVSVHRVIAAALGRDGYAGRFATRGHDGVRLARALLPDLIILDLTLPDIDGWSVLTRLQRESSLGSTPVIIVSTQDARADARRAGAAGFVAKPIDRDALLGLVRDELARARALPPVKEA